MVRDPNTIILSPLITEKSSREMGKGVYTFVVLRSATKVDIRSAVEKIFNVKVDSVNTVSVRGKVRGTFGKGFGRTKARKKAYVTLREGQKIEALEAR